MRLIFILGIVTVGGWYAVRSPFHALLFYVWNAYFRPENWAFWHADLITSLRISYVAASLIVGWTLLSGRRLRVDGRVMLLLAFTAQGLLSTWLSDYNDWAWRWYVEFVKVIVITYFMTVLVDDLTKLRMLVLTIVLSLGCEGAQQGWVEFFTRPGGANTNTIPFLGDNNGVAIGMLMLVPWVSALARTTDNRWARRGYAALLIGIVYRAITTYSRGALLAGATLGLVYLVRSPRKGRIVLVILVISAIVLPVLPSAFWQRMGTIIEGQDTRDASALGRLYFWGVALEMASGHPFVGVGFNAFNAAYNAYDPSVGEFGSDRSVHSMWFGVLSELGYPGLLLFLLIFGATIRSCWLVRRSAALSPEHGVLAEYALALEICLAVFFVGGTFLANQYNEMAWHYVGLGMVLRNLTESYDSRATEQAGSSAPLFPASSGATQGSFA